MGANPPNPKPESMRVLKSFDEDITQYPKTNRHENQGFIYFLYDKGELIYIGSSKYPYKRVDQHGCNEYQIFKVPLDEMWDYEAHYIVRYNPKLNKTLPSNRYFRTAENIHLAGTFAQKIIALENTKPAYKKHGIFYDVHEVTSKLYLGDRIDMDYAEYKRRLKRL